MTTAELLSQVTADLRRHGVKETERQGLPAEAVSSHTDSSGPRASMTALERRTIRLKGNADASSGQPDQIERAARLDRTDSVSVKLDKLEALFASSGRAVADETAMTTALLGIATDGRYEALGPQGARLSCRRSGSSSWSGSPLSAPC